MDPLAEQTMCGGHRSDTGRGSTGGGRIVQVRGYTKANGTYVAGYKRSLPGSGSKSKSTTTTQKSSYLTDTYGDRSANRKKNFNATQVQAIPRSPGAVAGPDARFFSLRKTVRVRGYTRSNGTYVAGCTRSLPSPKRNSEKSSVATSNGSSGLVSSARCSSHQTNPIGSSNGKVVLVKGYTRSDGTHVASYTRSLPTKKSKTFAAVHHELVPIATTGGDAQIAKCTKLAIKTHPILNHGSTCNAKPISGVQPKREHIKKEKLAVSGLLDTTNTSHLPTSRVSEQQKVHSKDSFKLHNSPLATGAKREHCHPAQTAVQVPAGSISRVSHNSDEFSKVAEKFRKDWVWEKRPHSAVNFIFKVTNNTLEQKWMDYKSTLREKDIKELYHGTKLSCKITTTWKLCDTGSCGICGISRFGLDPQCIRDKFQRFGTGFYLAPNSSKCHDYTQSYNGFKAILLCDVLPGRKYVVQTNRQHLRSPPAGYDSVYGNVGKDLNYPELVVYKSEAVLPRYIIVYRCI